MVRARALGLGNTGCIVAKPGKLKRLSPLQAEKQLAALEKLFNEQDVSIMTNEAYDRLKKEILERVVGK
jgi:hypothetical protein